MARSILWSCVPKRLGGAAADLDNSRCRASFHNGGRPEAVSSAGRPRCPLALWRNARPGSDRLGAKQRKCNGGYLDQQGPNELLVRSLGRIQSVEELKQVQITVREGRPVLLPMWRGSKLGLRSNGVTVQLMCVIRPTRNGWVEIALF